MSINEASKELYLTLRKFDEVIGTDVVTNNSKPYIVVYLEKATAAIIGKIPPNYKGNKVKTEVTSSFYSF